MCYSHVILLVRVERLRATCAKGKSSQSDLRVDFFVGNVLSCGIAVLQIAPGNGGFWAVSRPSTRKTWVIYTDDRFRPHILDVN